MDPSSEAELDAVLSGRRHGTHGLARPRGRIAIRIDRDGRWLYHGTPIERDAMVRLFAGLLRREGEDYVLDAPEQILRIEVDDAPFVVIDMEVEGQGGERRLWMTTNLGERFPVGAEHPLFLRSDPHSGETRLYLSARAGMPALVHRNVFYRLAEEVETDAASGRRGVHSSGMFFALE